MVLFILSVLQVFLFISYSPKVSINFRTFQSSVFKKFYLIMFLIINNYVFIFLIAYDEKNTRDNTVIKIYRVNHILIMFMLRCTELSDLLI